MNKGTSINKNRRALNKVYSLFNLFLATFFYDVPIFLWISIMLFQYFFIWISLTFS